MILAILLGLNISPLNATLFQDVFLHKNGAATPSKETFVVTDFRAQKSMRIYKIHTHIAINMYLEVYAPEN